ncbi:MAG: DUF2065 domain-containing protein [Betaproteobacteria bacterium]|nr:DUF2065 domain-containing protein [Betaproteobacteria bacterium]
MKESLLAGFAMMLVFEGLLPLLAPKVWRETMRQIAEFRDGQLRFIGLLSMAVGVVMLLMVN